MSTGQIVAEHAVRFVRTFDAPPEKVWDFLTNPSRLPEWFGEGTIEPREGGAVSLMGGHVRGVVTAWRPAQLLGYTWNVFAPGQSVSQWPVSYLELHLDGARLTLFHRPIPDAMQAQTMMGWHTMLDLTEAALRGDFPKRADLMAGNAARYGVALNNMRKT